jgi:hypothetical protein
MTRREESIKDLLIRPMSEFTGPTLGSVVITLNTDAAGLQFLIDEAYGLRYFSHDKPTVPGEDVDGVQ